MPMPDFQKMITGSEYDFLRDNEHLGSRVMLLGLSGSYGYGTNREGSDVDFRGVAMQRPSDILGLTEFEQYVDDKTDTVVYGFNKLVKLLLDCNPNSCEILGLPRDKYMILSPLGKELLDNLILKNNLKKIRAEQKLSQSALSCIISAYVFNVAFPNCFAFSIHPFVNPDFEKRKKCFF